MFIPPFCLIKADRFFTIPISRVLGSSINPVQIIIAPRAVGSQMDHLEIVSYCEAIPLPT